MDFLSSVGIEDIQTFTKKLHAEIAQKNSGVSEIQLRNAIAKIAKYKNWREMNEARNSKVPDNNKTARNILKTGTEDEIKAMISSLACMDEAGRTFDHNFWQLEAKNLLSLVVQIYCFFRDSNTNPNLIHEKEVYSIADFSTIKNLILMTREEKADEHIRRLVSDYLEHLPGSSEDMYDSALLGRICSKVSEQHGYRSMQFSSAITDILNERYNIFYIAEPTTDASKRIITDQTVIIIKVSMDSLSGGLDSSQIEAILNDIRPELNELLPDGRKKKTFLVKLDDFGMKGELLRVHVSYQNLW